MTCLCEWLILSTWYIFILIHFPGLGTTIFYVPCVRKGKGLLMIWKASLISYNGNCVHITPISIFYTILLDRMDYLGGFGSYIICIMHMW